MTPWPSAHGGRRERHRQGQRPWGLTTGGRSALSRAGHACDGPATGSRHAADLRSRAQPIRRTLDLESVAVHLAAAGYQVRVPSLLHIGAGAPPFWPRVAEAVGDDLREVPAGSPVISVAQSNAGLFLPTIRVGLDHPVTGSVFVDAAYRP